MYLENFVENIRYCFTVEDTGMKVYEILGTQVELSFCEDTENAPMELVCLQNNSEKPARIRVKDTLKEYGVPEGGKFYLVTCEGRFVETFRMIECRYHEVMLRTGSHWCQMNDDFSRSCREYSPHIYNSAYICNDGLFFAADGSVMPNGYRFPKSPAGNSVVYVQDGVGIDGEGMILMPEKDAYAYKTDAPLIAATEKARLCITSQRKILCRGVPTLEESDPAIEIVECDCGYVVLTKSGDIFFSANGCGWEKIGEHAVAMATCNRTVAYGDIQGNVYIYQYDRHTLACGPVLHFEGQITELAVSQDFVVLRFLDNTFDVADRVTGESLMGTRFIQPHFSYY